MTFVDREIRELTRAGYDIKTVSRGSPIPGDVDEETLHFYRDTLCLDRVGKLRLFFSQVLVLVRKPREWFAVLLLILREKEIKTQKDRLRLLHHFLEAGYLYTCLKNSGIEHIHAHILNAPTSIALFLGRYLDIPYSFTMHGSQIYLDPLMLGTKLARCKRAVTISDYNKQYLLNKYGKQFADKIDIIRCGIAPDAFMRRFRNNSGMPMILAVGRLIEIKGFRYLLDACRILRDNGMNFTCVIVGDGEEMDLLTKRSAALGVADVITFLGKQPQQRVFELLNEASIFVLPSIITDQGGREGIPVSLMEAMAMELPVISTRTSGIPELIEDNEEGLLVEHSNAANLAAAMEYLLRSISERERMGKQARKKVIREFNIHRIPQQFDAVFN